MDKQLRAEILATVRQAMTTYNEKWVTAEVLCENVGTLTTRWLRDHGQAFNRTRVEYDDEQGHHSQAWLYPLHEIMQWIQDGRIKELKC
jgi:lysyl-tRNA synthetase class I